MATTLMVMAGGFAVTLLIIAAVSRSTRARTRGAAAAGSSAVWMGDGGSGGDAGCDSGSAGDGGCSDGGGGGGGD